MAVTLDQAKNNYWDNYAKHNTTPAASKSATTNPTLEKQKMLKAAGYDPGPLDGISGPRTDAAYTAYKKSQTYQPAGVTDPRAYQPAAPKPTAPKTNSTIAVTSTPITPNVTTPAPVATPQATGQSTNQAVGKPPISGDTPTGQGTIVADPEVDIQDMIKQMKDAAKTEEAPHYQPNMVQLSEKELDEPIFDTAEKK